MREKIKSKENLNENKENATCNNTNDKSECKTPNIPPEGIEWARRIEKEIDELPFDRINEIKDLNIYSEKSNKNIIAIFGINDCPFVQKSIKMLTEKNEELKEKDIDAVYINFLNEGSNREFKGEKRACNGTPYFLAVDKNSNVIGSINGLPENFEDILNYLKKLNKLEKIINFSK